MLVYPAIDLIDGKCVRLKLGDFNDVKVYDADPVTMLGRFLNAGASWAHIVDLDGARSGALRQYDLLSHLANSSAIQIQCGGGIRTIDDIENLFKIGIARVVVGSAAVSDGHQVKEWLNRFGGDRITLALDCYINEHGAPLLKTNGWQNQTDVILWDLLEFYSNIKYVLCTDIMVDGTMAGPNLELYRQIQTRFPNINLLASGGIGKAEDLANLRGLNIHGAVIGKAIYEGAIDLDSIDFGGKELLEAKKD